MARQGSAFFPHPGFELGDGWYGEFLADGKTVGLRSSVDGALDVEDPVDALHRLKR